VLVELHNTETGRKKIITCLSEEKARSFSKLFNLVAAFSRFDERQTPKEDHDSPGALRADQFGPASTSEKKRI
jgi:hypothetical protein